VASFSRAGAAAPDLPREWLASLCNVPASTSRRLAEVDRFALAIDRFDPHPTGVAVHFPETPEEDYVDAEFLRAYPEQTSWSGARGGEEATASESSRGRVELSLDRAGSAATAIAELLSGWIQPVTTLVAGDFIHLAKGGSTLHIDLVQSADFLQLDLSLDHGRKDLPATHAAFQVERGEELEMPWSSKAFFGVVGRRQLAAWWRQCEAMLHPDLLTRFFQLESSLGILYGGRSIAEEVLVDLQPYAALLLARQAFAATESPPFVRYPAGLLRLHPKERDSFFDSTVVAFQSTVGVINVDRGKNHTPPMMVHYTEDARRTRWWGEFLPDDPERYDPIRHNVSPALGVDEDAVYIASAKELLEDLAPAGPNERLFSAAEVREVDVWIRVDVAELLALLRENREILEALALLKTGSFEASEASPQRWYALLGRIAEVEAVWVCDAKESRWTARLVWNPEEGERADR
jgi:hypothetical protein